jgi:hypothetical protein
MKPTSNLPLGLALLLALTVVLPVHLVSSPNSTARVRANTAAVEGARRSRPSEYFKLPLRFEANRGQTNKQVKFFARGSGYGLFLNPTEAVMRLRIADFRSRNAESQFAVTKVSEPQSANMQQSETVRMRLVEANASARLVGLDELESKSNYFIGNDPKKWLTDVPTYSRVKYENLYPGVDLVSSVLP